MKKKLFFKTAFLFSMYFLTRSEIVHAQVNVDWSKRVGGISYDQANSIAVDAAGNTYTTGYFDDTVDFDPGLDSFKLATTDMYDADVFVTKLDNAGNFVWAKQIGGTGYDISNSIALDAAGNVYITGFFSGTVDFNPGTDSFNLTSTTDASDIFICKLDANGNFIWAKSFAGHGYKLPASLTTDAAGNVYTTGAFNDTLDFDPGPGTYDLVSGISFFVGGYVAKLDVNGNFMWAKAFDAAIGSSIAVDASGSVYTTGSFVGSTDFDPGSETFILDATGGADDADIFISKLDNIGNFVWAKGIGGSGADQGFSITVNHGNYIYTTGSYGGTVDFDPGASVHNLTAAGGTDIFISKLDADGNYAWAKTMGGAGNDQANAIATDLNENVYTTGFFTGTADFNPGTATNNLSADTTGGPDNQAIFISQLDSTGAFSWARNINGVGSNSDGGAGIAVDTAKNIFVAGNFNGTLVDSSFSFSSADPGSSDFFILKLVKPIVADTNTDGIYQPDHKTNDIWVYPNPVVNGTTNLVVNAGSDSEFAIELADIKGQILKSIGKTKCRMGSNIVPIDVSGLSNGIYFLKVYNNQFSTNMKIIVNR